ncbi:MULTISPECIES: ABC transporter C-terminal domain-containing protein [unclassified Cupriavidus]|uniref:ABC transporter C-terminal domain-containing protein n=1 Tax=unclassified Cupriavidus TaxID=2640874 RepID=UPI001BFFE8CE|nr:MULTISPECIES: ABC transporter C-terminal domain-containing protein [unclassified Cupriavidus]MCA3189683.1 hypothetical protein [Cupriavidus sp.]MCA3195679.1 hypothetical protein [Cupriavidus sp.]MCA3203836.1 hypothetical protein [Cupriavidus sp.]MCA3209433.1 hypothetical protein [Cupriavidus sp.]MCA3233480.1 hypothetical protein [Cupriavidus sp.]
MPITMTADQLSNLPESVDPTAPRRQPNGAPSHDWRIVATIFTAVFIALGGIFAILEYAGRQTDKTNENIYYRFGMVDERLDVMDKRFDGLDRRIDGMDQRIERLETKVDEGFARIDARFAKVDERFDRLEAKVDRKFEQIDRNFAQVHESLAQMSGALQTLVEQKAISGTAAAGQTRGNRAR